MLEQRSFKLGLFRTRGRREFDFGLVQFSEHLLAFKEFYSVIFRRQVPLLAILFSLGQISLEGFQSSFCFDADIGSQFVLKSI